MRQAKARTVFGQQFNKTGVVGKDIDWPRFDVGKYALVEVFDLERHAAMLANMRTRCNRCVQ